MLLLCAAVEFDTGISRACADAQSDSNSPYPTFSLALSILDDPSWDVVAPDRPLRYWRLIEINQSDARPLVTRQLRADERIVNFIKGLNHIDERLLPYVRRVVAAPNSAELPPSHRQIADDIEIKIRQSLENGLREDSVVVQLSGIDRLGKREIVEELTYRLRIQPFELATSMLPSLPLEIDQLVRLWRRESVLMPVCLYVPEVESPTDANASRSARQFVQSVRSLVFVEVDGQSNFGEHKIICDVCKPTHLEQAAIWHESLDGVASDDVVRQLSSQFHLSGRTIRKVARSAIQHVDADMCPQLWSGCRAATRPKLDDLTQRIDTKATWDDIVLPDAQTDQLRQIASQVRHRSTVYDDWGFREKMNRGLGITALFAGPSGTGKTMAAEVLANDLQLDLYRIDLSAVVNKYIGETEKNLRRIFDAADDGGVILFFDEADALFGKRSDVKDSHDRYANLEVSYLLQRMESYRGLAILATNMKASLDKAFLRRLRFIVDMPMPDAKQRRQIWKKAFPHASLTRGLDYESLASLKLSGGNIHSVSLNAAFRSASSQTSLPQVSMPMVFDAVEAELRKLERPTQHVDRTKRKNDV